MSDQDQPGMPSPAQLLAAIALRLSETVLDPTTPPSVLGQLGAVALKAANAAAAAAAREDAPPPTSGHPDLPPLMAQISGPPWDPWRDLEEPHATALEREFRARRIVALREEADELETPELRTHVLDVLDDLAALRAGKITRAALQVGVERRLTVPKHTF